MSAIIPFTFEAAPVRVTDQDGCPWFDDEKGVATTDTLGGPQAGVAA